MWDSARGLRAVVLAGAAAACSSSGGAASPGTGGGTGPGAGGTTGAGGTGISTCLEDFPCACPDGLSGRIVCSPVESCACPQCPEFVADTAPPTAGCGGEPFGDWIADTAEVTAAPLEIYSNSAILRGTCPAEVLEFDPAVDMRLVIADGGVAALSWSGVRLKRRYTASCLRGLTDDTCEQNFCTSTCCGLCECDDDIVLSASGDYDWTRTATTLTLTARSFPRLSRTFAYCVDGDRMTLERDGVRFTLRKATFAGAPVACAPRPLADCTKGTGCRIGECVGMATCATSTTEATCTNRQGCSWDTSRCAGTAVGACTLAEYGAVPGCGIYQPGATCGGTPTACFDIPAAQCTGVLGCQVRDACQGPAIDCRQIWDLLRLCDYDVGCSESTSGGCVGASTCVAQPTQLRCKSRYDCVWALGVCAGTPPACATNTLISCTKNPGCTIQGTPL